MNSTFLKVLRIVAILVCVGIIAFESFKIYTDQKEYTVADTEYEELEKKAVIWPSEEDTSEVVDYPLLNIDFDALTAINNDCVAWIYFPCIEITYPVVQETYIDQYIHTTFDGQPNKAGCIYMDILSDKNFCGMHDIVFGHNMKNQSMFGKLKLLYKNGNEHLLEENPYVYVYTKDHVYQYRVFGYYITNVGSYSYTNVTNNSIYDEFVDYISIHSLFKRPEDVDLTARPNLLTLSTCSGTAGSGKRFVVHTYKTNTWDR